MRRPACVLLVRAGVQAGQWAAITGLVVAEAGIFSSEFHRFDAGLSVVVRQKSMPISSPRRSERREDNEKRLLQTPLSQWHVVALTMPPSATLLRLTNQAVVRRQA